MIPVICGARRGRPAEADPEARLELAVVSAGSEVAPAVEVAPEQVELAAESEVAPAVAAPEQVVLAVESEVAAPAVRLAALQRPAAIRASG